jgi:hypothetical protein
VVFLNSIKRAFKIASIPFVVLASGAIIVTAPNIANATSEPAPNVGCATCTPPPLTPPTSGGNNGGGGKPNPLPNMFTDNTANGYGQGTSNVGINNNGGSSTINQFAVNATGANAALITVIGEYQCPIDQESIFMAATLNGSSGGTNPYINQSDSRSGGVTVGWSSTRYAGNAERMKTCDEGIRLKVVQSYLKICVTGYELAAKYNMTFDPSKIGPVAAQYCSAFAYLPKPPVEPPVVQTPPAPPYTPPVNQAPPADPEPVGIPARRKPRG